MKNYKEQILYYRKIKLTHLGYGDWIDEPDEVTFEYRGLKCEIHRLFCREIYSIQEAYFGGHLCGYIYIPKSHPLYGKNCDDLNCWGGITFSDCYGDFWKIGFDCAHAGDIVPSVIHLRKKSMPEYMESLFKTRLQFFPTPTYKNISFCVKQCKLLAKQLDNIKKVQPCPENGA